MEAQTVGHVPAGPGWLYEPKWDGFRCLVFRDLGKVELQSKSCRSLTRYFPELVQAALALPVRRFVLDGEIMVPQAGVFSFDALLQRIHPAESRVKRLAAETPAQLLAFDLLADAQGRSLIEVPLRERRAQLESFAGKYLQNSASIRLSPATTNLAEAKAWLEGIGRGLDGIIAKPCAMTYRSGERSGMQKIKLHRTADCVVGGFRYNEGRPVAGSLLLGLYDDQGLLNHVGFAANIAASDKPALTARLKKLIAPPGFTGRAPGGPSRWSSARSNDWEPLKPKLVVEVSYDHVSGGRFRHGTKLLRWRPDKSPRLCTMEQLRQPRAGLSKLLQYYLARVASVSR